MECNKNSSKLDIHGYTGLQQETKKIPNKPSNSTSMGTGGRGWWGVGEEQIKPKVNSRREIIKIGMEIKQI